MSKITVSKYIFSSTSAVYGDYQLKFSEQSKTRPISNYGAMKLASEAILSAYSNASKTKTYIIRFPNVIGKNMTHGLIYDLVNKNLKNPNYLKILGNGNQKKQYMKVNSLLKSIFFILKKSKERYSVYNVAPEDNGIKVSSIVNLFTKYNKLKTKIFYEKNLTLLQALGLAGDLTINGVRKKITIIRTENGEQSFGTIDLTKNDWFATPYYFVKPNDVIIVDPNTARVKSSGVIGNPGNVISIVSALLSSIIVIKTL